MAVVSPPLRPPSSSSFSAGGRVAASWVSWPAQRRTRRWRSFRLGAVRRICCHIQPGRICFDASPPDSLTQLIKAAGAHIRCRGDGNREQRDQVPAHWDPPAHTATPRSVTPARPENAAVTRKAAASSIKRSWPKGAANSRAGTRGRTRGSWPKWARRRSARGRRPRRVCRNYESVHASGWNTAVIGAAKVAGR
jgi:hypothetical protein